MRKYWKRCGEKSESSSQLSVRRDGHWTVLMTLIKASAGQVSLDELSDALSCAFRKDVEGYLSASKRYLADHSSYSARDVISIRASRSIWSFLKKFPFSRKECQVDRKAAARAKLIEAELQCKATNTKIRGLDRSDIPPFIWRARFHIAQVLGECRSSIMDILSMARPGKGSTVSNVKAKVTPYYKFADLPYTCTKRAARYALAMISGDPHWWEILENSGRRREIPFGIWPHGNMSVAQSQRDLFLDCVTFVESDIIQFVPKDATTDRPMAVGASLNMMLQLGVNEYITDALLGHGLNLRDQERNQILARLGSLGSGQHCLIAGEQFSTIDLSSASDTIAYKLVELLLPSDWFAFLCDLRHVSGELHGATLVYEKFSAMGNGFTFPLESLIFWAVSKAAHEVNGIPCNTSDIAVYGDDIIIRAKGASATIEALEWCGFKVNTEKSFITGCFKESCGADFWDGLNIRPIHLKRKLDEKGLYYLANRLADIICYGPSIPGHYAMYSACVSLLGSGRSYGPLRQLDASVAKGLSTGIPEDYLSVPIQSLSHPGLRPFLSSEELAYLSARRLFPNALGAGTKNYEPLLPDVCEHNGSFRHKQPVVLYKTDTPRSFKGKASVRYYIDLRRHAGVGIAKGGFFLLEDYLHIEAMMAGRITRRGELDTVWRARPVYNWNGDHARDIQNRHPAMWVDLAA